MSCLNCDNNPVTTFVRVGNGDVKIAGCQKHLRQLIKQNRLGFQLTGVRRDYTAAYFSLNGDEVTPVDLETISDGYHTFKELYEFRMLYNAEYFNLMAYLASEYGVSDKMPMPVKSKRHSDGELCFGGEWFVVVVQLPTGQITNHYEMKDWDLFQIDEVNEAPEWDGHTPADVASRLRADLERTA